jgi:hypothetical protein
MNYKILMMLLIVSILIVAGCNQQSQNTIPYNASPPITTPSVLTVIPTSISTPIETSIPVSFANTSIIGTWSMADVPVGDGPAIQVAYDSSQMVFNDPKVGHTIGCGRNDCGDLDIQMTYIGNGVYTWVNEGSGTYGYITMIDNDHFIYSLVVGNGFQLNMRGGPGPSIFANATYYRVE